MNATPRTDAIQSSSIPNICDHPQAVYTVPVEFARQLERENAQKQAPLRWAARSPTAPGWYWWRYPNFSGGIVYTEVVEVRFIDGALWASGFNSPLDTSYNIRGGVFAGPIQQPLE